MANKKQILISLFIRIQDRGVAAKGAQSSKFQLRPSQNSFQFASLWNLLKGRRHISSLSIRQQCEILLR